ncbi:MAG: AAA family ATPase [Fuerstiella sp.]|jgi:chromosome segregation protein|nr:AAA family ATPase [Fuerstiella sp.]
MLKSLELFGFKSFADKTVFEFHEGITGVVGPNGSGKSNVVDSIKWLLGDQSAKSLRGKEMTDVIFNGSSSRGGAQFAEATLVFDNSSRFLPLENDEVSVGRRLWKSGDSEYLINRNTARLKDVRELLVGTGAGAASYCIIEQGRVDQILQSNAANRRLIFEEAAGISRFKQRRNEAERRLERVEQNLLRLTDIVDEVESQVNAVRNQAKRAMQLRDVSTELEKLWVGMVADDFRRQSMVRETLTKTKDEASAHLTEMRERQQQAERELTNADLVLAEVDDELREVERNRAELRSRIASLETTLRHHSGRESELQSEGLRLTRQRTLMDGRVGEAEKEEQHLQNVLALEQKRFAERRKEQEDGAARLHELHASLDTAQAGIQQSRDELIEQSRQNTELATRLGGLRHEQQSLQQRRGELLEARDVLIAETTDLEQQLKNQNELMDTAQAALHAAEEFGDRLLNERDDLLNEQSQSRDSLAELREQRSAAVARKTVLEDLEVRQEGFGIGAREILKRAEEGASEPWSLIRGSVADLLDVDMENAALLEVALSGRAQLLVIDRLSPLIDYLNSGRCQITDRVGFVSLEDSAPAAASEQDSARDPETKGPPDTDGTAHKGSQNPTWCGDLALGMFGDDWLDSDIGPLVSEEFVPELNVTWVDENGEIPIAKSVFSSLNSKVVSLVDMPGVVGRADSLARSPRHIPTLASQLLADTWVVQSLNDALRLQTEVGDDYRFITLQGELVEKDRTLFTGSIRSESAVVSRKSELRRLKNELHRIEHLVSERDIRLQKIVGFIESADEELQTGRDTVNRCTAELRTHQQSVAELQQAMNAGQANDRKLTDQLGSLSAAIATLEEQIVDGRTEQEAAEEQFEKLQGLIEAAERDLVEDRRQVDILEKGRTEADLELTRSEERLLGIRDAVERLEDDLQQRRLQQQEAARRQKVGTERLAELNLSQLNVNAEMSELHVNDDQLTTRIMQRSEARQLLRQHRQEATAAEQQARETCRQHETMFHEAEMKINAINHQLETSAERIQDEFQISVEQAVQSGRSAIAVWLTEHADADSETLSIDEDGQNDVQVHGDDSPETAATDSAGGSFDEPLEITVDDASVQQILRDDERYEPLRAAVDDRIGQLRRQLKKIGNVGTESLNNLNELESRFGRLHSQLQDLEAARDTLREMVRQINVESQRMFEESFECIRGHFRELFRRLFGGGEADVILEDPEDVLECAIDVVARPPGKELRSISLLSGGEKTMTAVALLLSIFKSRPSPFCILDEVDAALDDANIARFVGVLKDFQQETQFIMITHRKPTMAVTDVLYGVTMEESGISKRLVVRFEEIDEKGNFVPRQGTQNRAA